MNKEKSASGILGKYLRWPVLFIILMAAATVGTFFLTDDQRLRLLMIAATLIGIIAAAAVYLYYRYSITKSLVNFALDMDEEQGRLARDLDVPYALMDKAGNFVWKNEAFEEATGGEKAARKDIQTLFSDIDENVISKIAESATFSEIIRDKTFKVIIRRTQVDEETAYAVYLYDETELYAITKKYDDDTQIVGLMYLDNYDEISKSMEEVKKSLLVALVDRTVGKYIADLDGIIRKLETDKYLFIIKKMYLSQLEAERFSILEEVKKVNIGNELKVTVSIGIGYDSESYAENLDNAKTAIEMALARGGDQAVVKEGKAIRYYGGKSQSIEKSTRVRARVKAGAFREILAENSRVVIMGHKLMDIDCLGAAVGIWKTAASLSKPGHIVLGEASGSVRQMIDRFHTSDYPEDMFVTKAQAMDLIDEGTVLVVVDVNRPSLTEAPELIDIADTIVVFDHHRQGVESIEQATLSYIEPYASSACEMISEIVQYIDDDIRLKSSEADAMFAGIAVDTYNFTNQAGVRTFEAAAYLRKNGADVTRVRKLFRDSLEDYRAKAEAIHMAEVFEGAFAISECNGEGLESPTIIGAQAANELLDIEGVKASFVFTKFRDQIFVSARSIDEVNVQIIMEKMGGGGHRSIAGTQLRDVTVKEGMDQLKELLTDMIKKGELDV
ncbi:MAG: DHH family phosphoesterase [Lachnospiraceae bacterium]|nr:DHH family phosphoesterase [Lachnospiraceae bacterium]